MAFTVELQAKGHMPLTLLKYRYFDVCFQIVELSIFSLMLPFFVSCLENLSLPPRS